MCGVCGLCTAHAQRTHSTPPYRGVRVCVRAVAFFTLGGTEQRSDAEGYPTWAGGLNADRV
jgi:hypothetical protein